MVLHITKVHIGDTMQKLGQAFISLGNSGTQFVAVYIKIIEQSGKAAFRRRTLGRAFNMVEYPLQCFVQIFVMICSFVHITKQLRRENEKAFFFNQSLTGFLCFLICHFRIIKIRASGILFSGIDVIGQIFGDISVKHRAQDIVFEIPAVHGAAQFICNGPYCSVKLVPFLLFFGINHCFRSPFHLV